MIPEFTKRGVKLIALSCDDVDTHKGWMEDIKAFIKTDLMDFPYPIIADQGRELAVKLGMVDPDEKDAQGMPLTCRAVGVLTVFPNKYAMAERLLQCAYDRKIRNRDLFKKIETLFPQSAPHQLHKKYK